ncbi:NAD(P)H-binding protein [Nocardioides sp. NPDC006273]|uniref:NAD(P)H-binding protein n=1 Tax=Nocardioides sp. NPDC006273 TaxID=3155598 RepID=UPI0033BE00BA
MVEADLRGETDRSFLGGVSRTMVDMLLEQGHPVRALVRQDDERAHSLRHAGDEVFVGDMLTIADVAAALKVSGASTSAWACS